MSYVQRAVLGMGWTSSLKIYAKILTVLKVLVLARVLQPNDLGLFGLTAVILSLSEVLTETGINQFLIRSKQSIDKYVDTAFTLSVLRGFLIGLGLLFLAEPIAVFYKDPQLAPLLMVAALVTFIRGLINPSLINLQKELRFRDDTLLRGFIMSLEAGVGIGLAIYWHSALGLVWALAVSALIEVVLTHLVLHPRPHLRWSKLEANEIFRFGRWHNLNGLFAYLGQTADDLLIGRLLGSTQLGFYEAGFNIAQAATNDLGDASSQAMYPILSRVRDDKPSFRRAILWFIILTSLLLVGTTIVMASLATPLVTLVLGTKWLPIVPVLPWLLGAGLLQGINNLAYPMYLAMGEPKHQLPVNAVYLVVMVSLLIPFSHAYGLVGVGMALLLARLVVQPIAWYRFWRASRTWR